MGISRVLGFCAALLFASSVTAANVIDLGPSDWRRWGSGTSHHHTNGLNNKFGQTVRMPPMNTSLTVTRNAVIPYGSIANGMKNFARITPVSAAVTAAFIAMDWYFDQDRGEWVKDDISEVDPIDGYFTTNISNTPYPTPEDACYGSWGSNIREARYVGNDQWQCRTSSGYLGVANGEYICPEGAGYDRNIGKCVLSGPTSLTDSDFSELASELPNMPANIAGGSAEAVMQRQGAPLSGYSDMTIEGPSSVTGPQSTSTSTDPVTGDTVVTTTNTTTNISYGDTTITTSNTTTSTTYQNGQETSTTVTTETPGELPVLPGAGEAVEWPVFCDWATVVCDWFNWTQEEPPPDIDLPQVIDDDFFTEKTISFGAKSCPPDHEINLAPFLEITVGVSFQPLCDFASLIYYMVMAASYIIAAYISVGVARNG